MGTRGPEDPVTRALEAGSTQAPAGAHTPAPEVELTRVPTAGHTLAPGVVHTLVLEVEPTLVLGEVLTLGQEDPVTPAQLVRLMINGTAPLPTASEGLLCEEATRKPTDPGPTSEERRNSL